MSVSGVSLLTLYSALSGEESGKDGGSTIKCLLENAPFSVRGGGWDALVGTSDFLFLAVSFSPHAQRQTTRVCFTEPVPNHQVAGTSLAAKSLGVGTQGKIQSFGQVMSTPYLQPWMPRRGGAICSSLYPRTQHRPWHSVGSVTEASGVWSVCEGPIRKPVISQGWGLQSLHLL